MTFSEFKSIHSRRLFLRDCAGGLGTLALSHLLSRDGLAATKRTDPLAPKAPPFAPKAKNVIFLFMEGAPSQIDLFDPKPELKKWHGKSLPESLTSQLKLAFIKPTAAVLASPREFKPYGQCGTEFSDFLPHTAQRADDICLIRSMYTEAFNHHPGQLLLMSGSTQIGRPTMGAWALYGLGSESENLPGFAVLSSGVGTQRRRIELHERLYALDLPGRPVSQLGRSHCVSVQSSGHHPRCAAGRAGCVEGSERAAL